jgi:SAM-dependent methyltransferase
VFELGTLPLGFPIEPSKALANQVWRQKLELVICKRCYLVQTVHKIPKEELVSENLYSSSSSKLVSDHDEQFSSNIPSLLSLSKDSLILEIGCGDGSLLEKFYQKGFSNLIGIEPSAHSEKGYPFEVITDFLNADVVRVLSNRGKYPDCIIAKHVIDLVPDLDLLFSNLANLMKNGAFVIIEVPYLIDFLNAFRIDGFAHLECCWFTINSLIYALDKYNMGIVSIEHETNYRGGTLRVIAKKGYQKEISNLILDWKNKEVEELSPRSFNAFRDKIDRLRRDIRSKIAELTEEKKIPIYGYGGGLKASTLVNWLNLTSKEIKMVVDIDHNKHYKMIPIANIPIKPVPSLFNLAQNAKIAVIILALDHVNEVEAILSKRLGKGSLIIHPLPEFKTIVI